MTFTARDSGAAPSTVPGFWDGDGAGGSTGGVFRVRFCPISAGRWTISQTTSNHPALAGQRVGDYLEAKASVRPGFWTPDAATGGRWYRRSDGSRPYIIGNTHYNFVSGQAKGRSNGASIESDIAGNAAYFNKLRFSVVNDLYAHPTITTFFDDNGTGTNDGAHSLRPNPAWFQRVDRAVRAAHAADLIADLILNGVDGRSGRQALKAGANAGDAVPWLRYLAARYGSYPNVWFCLTNEYNTKAPTFTPAEVSSLGVTLRQFLAYPIPVSVHGDTGNWNPGLNLNPSWHDHAITQLKLYTLAGQARHIRRNFALAGCDRPVFNDEAAYEGAGDRVSEVQALTAVLGVFAGGGYASTGFKAAKPIGQYFWGAFDPTEHASADNLRWLRERIDALPFWRLSPQPDLAPFVGVPDGSVVLAEPDRLYLLFSPAQTIPAAQPLTISLPAGSRWSVTRWDPLAMETIRLVDAIGDQDQTLNLPASAGPLVHVWERLSPPASPTDYFSPRPLTAESNTEINQPSDPRAFLGREGLVVMEGEHANRRAANGDQFSWTDAVVLGAVGEGSVGLPAAGTVAPDNEAASLEWTFLTDRGGPHVLWIRWQAWDRQQEKTLLVSLDSARIRHSRGGTVRFLPAGPPDAQGWVWSRLELPLPIGGSGPHLLTLLRREDGVILDRLLLSADASFIPSGFGPDESPRASPHNQS